MQGGADRAALHGQAHTAVFVTLYQARGPIGASRGITL